MTSLADRFHQWTYDDRISREIGGRMGKAFTDAQLNWRIAMRKARRFTLDDQFTREVVRKANTGPGTMLSYMRLANLPFDSVWIECDMDVRVKESHAIGTLAEAPHLDDAGMQGYLIERLHPDVPSAFIVTCIGMPRSDDAKEWTNLKHLWMPVGMSAYQFNTEGALPLPTDNTMWADANGLGWGYALDTVVLGPHPRKSGDHIKFTYMVDEELSKRATAYMEPRFVFPVMKLVTTDKGRDNFLDQFGTELYENRGDLRFITTMLAMLNTVPLTYRYHEAKGWQRKRLRNVPFLDRTEITIHAGRAKVVNVVDHALKGHGTRHKRHEVRGFWKNVEYTKGMRACSHLPVERDGDYALCGGCMCLIKWVEHHERGDAALGWVTHDYRVTT